jgi:hypothetical protein
MESSALPRRVRVALGWLAPGIVATAVPVPQVPPNKLMAKQLGTRTSYDTPNSQTDLLKSPNKTESDRLESRMSRGLRLRAR